MGEYSTMDIKREDAIEVLKEALESEHITDEELGDMLSAVFGERKLLNFRINPAPDDSYLSYRTWALKL
jgi:hypothetical protein